MRVIAGYAKGHKLASLKGMQTRPTADRVKEAMFSIIQLYIGGSTALDLFAGSGSLGIEALSRGAKWCDFVEQSKIAVNVIKSNLQKTRLENWDIYNLAASDYLMKCDKKYDIVFLDPPYHKKLCDESLRLLYEKNLLNSGAIAVCETSAEEEVLSKFPVRKYSVYGSTKLTIFENR